MRFFPLSDIHADFKKKRTFEDYFNGWIPKNIDTVIIAGDIATKIKQGQAALRYLADNHQNIIYVMGNHDITRVINDRIEQPLDDYIQEYHHGIHRKNVHLLNGNIIDIDGVKFGGTIGACDFSYNFNGYSKDFLKDRWKFEWYDGRYLAMTIEEHDDFIKKQMDLIETIALQPIDVMVTHYVPSNSLTDAEYRFSRETAYFNFNGDPYIETLANNNGKHWIYGHTHKRSLKYINGVQMICNPMGYRYSPGNDQILPLTDFESFVFEI
jgi:predicted phosphodiesterase